MTKENEELKKRMSGVEEMVANLIVDQQAMAKAFQERGDRHGGSLERLTLMVVGVVSLDE